MNDDLPNYTWFAVERSFAIHCADACFWNCSLSEAGFSFENDCIILRNEREVSAAADWLDRLAHDLDHNEVTVRSRCLKVENISPEFSNESSEFYRAEDLTIKASRTNIGTYIGDAIAHEPNGTLIQSSLVMRELAELFREIGKLMTGPGFLKKITRKEPIK